MRVAAILIAPVLLFATPAYAYFSDGEDLREFCTPSTPSHNVERCVGYISGVFDMFELNEVAIGPDGEVSKRTACLPKGYKNVDVAKAVISYIYDTPEELDLPAAAVIVNALVKNFPCAD